jgi:hypothetical protein
MRDIINKNNKGDFHGYNEWYWNSGKLRFRGNMKNNKVIGYTEWHGFKETEYYIR